MNTIVGTWVSDPEDVATGSANGRVTQSFHPDGSITFKIHQASDVTAVMLMTYVVDGNELVTDQPSAPREHRTRFMFDEKGRLVLDNEGTRSRFIRVE